MNINDINVSVIKVEAADSLLVKAKLPALEQQIADGITQATSRSPAKKFSDSKDVVGETVLAKLKDEQGSKYRRAIVKSVCNPTQGRADPQVNVFFIDDGVTDAVPFASLLPCSEEMKKLEPLARTLQLANLKALTWQPTMNKEGKVLSLQAPSDNWAPAAMYHVKDLMEYGEFSICKAEVLRTDEEGVWHGDLHFSRDNSRYRSLRRELFNNQFAEEFMTEPPPSSKPKLSTSASRGLRLGPRSRPVAASSSPSTNLQANLANTYLVCGTKPYPDQLGVPEVRNYSQIVRKVHEFQPTYQPFIWAGVDMARNIFLTMPDETLQLDENAISILLPSLMDAIPSTADPVGHYQLKALFIVPSGPIGSKLSQQLSTERVGLKNKVKFLYSVSADGDASDCQVLILTPAKLSQFLKNPALLKMENLKMLSFLLVDELMKNEEDRAVLHAFKAEVSRFRNVTKSIRLFGLTKTCSSIVLAFYDEWFRSLNPLNYFLDLAEASVFLKTRHTFVHAQRDVLPRCLLESLQNLQKNDHRVAIFCPDDDFEWILSVLKQNSITVLPLEPQLSGIVDRLATEFNHWAVSPEKQCLLVPDSLLRPEVGMQPHLSVGPTAIIHAVSIKDKAAFRARFMLMKPIWLNSSEPPATESILLLDSLPFEMCNYVNDLLVRSGSQPNPVIANWLTKSPTKAAESTTGEASSVPKVDSVAELCPLLLQLGKCGEESICKMRHVFKAKLDDCHAEPSKYTPISHLATGGRASFQIQNVIQGNHFTGILKSPVNSAEAMMRINNLLRACHENRPAGGCGTPKIGQLYGVAFDHNAVFRRAVVVKKLGFNESNFYSKSAVLKKQMSTNLAQLYTFSVRLVDHGAMEVEVQGDQLFPLSEDLAKEPWLSVEIILCKIRPSDRAWPRQVRDLLKSKLVGREFEASVALVLRHQVFVTNLVHREICSTIGNQRATVTDVRNLLTSGTDAAAAVSNPEHLRNLVEMCLGAKIDVPSETLQSLKSVGSTEKGPVVASPTIKNRPSKPSKLTELDENSLPEDESSLVGTVLVRISSVHCPGTFFVHRIDTLENLARMERTIDEWVRSEGEPEPMSCEVLSEKHLCLARLPIDERRCWSRVIIQQVHRDTKTVTIFAVDHGEVETISVDDLRPMSEHLAKYPAFAIECRLAHVKPYGNAENFSEEAGSVFWDLGFLSDGGSSREFRARVVYKARRGFFCKSALYVVELLPALELEKENLPRETYIDLSVSAQLIRQGLVWSDFSQILDGLRSLKVDDAAISRLVTQVLPNSLDDANFDVYLGWMDVNSSRLADFIHKNVPFTCQLMDFLVTVAELGDDFDFEIATDLLLTLISQLDLFGIADEAQRDLLLRTLFGLTRRILPVATFRLSLTLESKAENAFQDDDLHANMMCQLLNKLIPLVTSCNDFAQEAIQLCIRSGIMAVLIKRLSAKDSFEKIPECFQLLADLIKSPLFPPFLRKMNAFKSTPFASHTLVETRVWERLATTAQHLFEHRYPVLLTNLLKSVTCLMMDNNDYVTVVDESELGAFLRDLTVKLDREFEDETALEWSDVQASLRKMSILFNVYWQTNFDPDTDSDRFNEKRIRPSYRLPPSSNGSDFATPNSSQGADSFGAILWSQNPTHVFVQVDNPFVTKTKLLAQVLPVDEDQVLRLTIMTAHRSLDIHLFGRVDEEFAIRDKFRGAVLKLRKQSQLEWTSLESHGKRLASVRFNFDAIDQVWSDDDDDDDDEYDEEDRERKRAMLAQPPPNENDAGPDGDIENSLKPGEAAASHSGVLSDDVTEQLLMSRVRAQLPEDFPGDDDEFD